MVADDTFLARARPWFDDNRRELIRALIAPLVLTIAWWMTDLVLPPLVWTGIVCYCLIQLALIGVERLRQPANILLLDVSALAADAGLALLLLNQAQHLNNAIYPLYLLIAIRVLAVYQRLPIATIIPFVLGPTYLFAQSLSNRSVPLSLLDQGARWSLLLGSLWFGVVAICASAAQRHENLLLRQELRDANFAAELRVAQLESTTHDLRARMREQHALEEGLRVITSTLSLDEVLSQIVDSTIQMLGSSRVHGMALSMHNDGAFQHHLLLLDEGVEGAWTDLLAQRVVQQQVPLIISDVYLDSELVSAAPSEVRSALSVPLFVGEGPARGALTVVSANQGAFSSSDARHLIAFAMQAGIAIGNAEMHSQLRRQQHLLEAVVRDISDGLVVMDRNEGIVLTNPLGRTLLDSATAIMPVREQLLTLAESMQTVDKDLLTCEIRIVTETEDGEYERTYQALASQVHQNGSDEPLIAIVLHDITAQKDEERNRNEFISMVAHELRNPLNSLNGFVKILLQGRAGSLTPLQHEFLQIVDSQADQLKGRISELLEFNRMEAGRLVLNPQWNEPSVMVATVATRLKLQAEQAGLELVNEANFDLPETVFDSERIGQVLTNLVENAIKATAPGGRITICSEVHEDEIWLRVCDTGVGIPAEEQAKIFQAFYRAHDQASSRGNHLGLGLAICLQIIEGHNGRIWVESEHGKGSCFTFALPRYEREYELGR